MNMIYITFDENGIPENLPNKSEMPLLILYGVDGLTATAPIVGNWDAESESWLDINGELIDWQPTIYMEPWIESEEIKYDGKGGHNLVNRYELSVLLILYGKDSDNKKVFDLGGWCPIDKEWQDQNGVKLSFIPESYVVALKNPQKSYSDPNE